MKSLFGLLLATLVMAATGCSSPNETKKNEPAAAESEAVQLTAWTAKTELFMEYEPLQPGKKRNFLIHLTRLADGRPVSEGPLKLALRPVSGEPLTVTVPAPSKPGVYQVELTAPAAGSYTLELTTEGKGFADRIELPGITVGTAQQNGFQKPHAGHDHAETAVRAHQEPDDHGHDDHDHDHDAHDHAADRHDDAHGETAVVVGGGGGTIALLKGQQWALDILVRQPQHRRLTGRLVASGELIAAADSEATVAAPLSGLLSVARPLPHLGKRVAKGELIALIEPPIRPDGGVGQFSAALAEARNRVILARQEHERAQRLFEAKIASRKRVEEASAALDSARSALAPLEKSAAALGGDIGGRLAVRAPVSGSVVELFSGTGRGIEAGQPILRIVNTATLWLKTSLPAIDAGKLPAQPSADFTVTGQQGSFTTGRLISVGDMLDPQSRTLPVIFSVPNRDARLKVGMFASVSVATGTAGNGLVLPVEALVEDEGRFFVFVQTSAERFVRREVQLGVKDGTDVQILKGLEDHDRVVVKGSYYVKQAALSATKEDPHAGHAH